MRGRALPPGTGPRLLLAGRAVAWFGLATGQVTTVAGLPPSPFPYVLTQVPGGWAAQGSVRGHACQPDCPDPWLPVYFIADGLATARRIAVTEELGVGSGQGALWLESYPRGTTDMTVTPATARQVALSGRQIGSAVRLPAGFLIRRQVGRDLLLGPVVEGPGPVLSRLWDPVARRVVRTFPDVLAADSAQIAWSECGGCAVGIYDVRTGRRATIAVPAHSWPYDGVFSADGRLLAVHLSGGVTPDGRATLSRIAVIDVTRRALQVLRGSAVGVDLPESLTFGWRGHELIAAVTGVRREQQVGLWQPGSAGLLVRWLRPPHGMMVTVGGP